jgi:peroxiredoxin
MSDLINRFAPDFSLPLVTGGRFALGETRGNLVVLTFWSAECPWSRRADVMLVYRSLRWAPKGVRLVGIASNLNETETEILHEIENRGVKYPIVMDPDQNVANAYKAQTTPHFFALDKRGVVRYAGALDDATFKQPRPKVIYLDRAVNALLDNKNPEPAVTLPYGCSLVRPSQESAGPAVQTTPPPATRP